MSELDQYDYELPAELIAQEPLACRSDARLLIVRRQAGELEHARVRDLPEFLQPADALVLNDTRVVPARLVGYRTRTGGKWQGLFLAADDAGLWKVLSKTRGKLEPGETIMLQNRQLQDALPLRLLTRLDRGEWAARPESDEPALDLLQRIGRVPLPHYIRGGEMIDADLQTYQTVYATRPGAVAAPTAGLHFTPQLLQRIEQRGVATARVTLHVGIGTFRPITVERLRDHAMHSEWGQISAETVALLRQRRQAGGRIVAVGTTAVRVLETAAASGELQPWTGETSIFIRPPHTFQAVDALLTNFHLPKSTLLVLVRTFGGDELMRRAYAVAVEERYRFFSYGDAMLIV